MRSATADTNSSETNGPASSGPGGVVTPELVLVDPELALAQRQTTHRKAAMSSTEPANTFPDEAQPTPAPAPEHLPSPAPAPDPVTPEQAEAPAPPPAAAQAPPATPMVDVPLGTLIFRAGLLAEEQLEEALQEGMRTGKRLGEVLIERGWVNERDLGSMLAGQKGLPFVEVSAADVDPSALEALGEEDARRQVALPLRYEHGVLVIAVGDPSNQLVLEGLRREIRTEFRLVVAPHGQLQQAIDEAYSRPAPQPEPEPVFAVEPEPQQQPELSFEAQPEPVFAVEPQPEPEPSFEALPAPEPVFEAQPEPPALPEPPVDVQPEPQPILDFSPVAQPEPQPESNGEAPVEAGSEPKQPFAGATPTLLSRMLFPSVRQAAQEVETPAAKHEELPAPAEDLEQLAVAEVPEMPLPSSTQQPAAEEPAFSPAESFEPVDEAEPAPTPAPVAFEPPPLPAEPEPEPVAAQPEPAVLQPQPAVEEPEPLAAQPEPQSVEESQPSTHFVLVRLTDGETLQVGEFATAAEATACAQEAVGQISAAASDASWPLFAGRYLRPDTIASVDLLERPAED